MLLLKEYGFVYDSSFKGDDYRREVHLWALPTSYEFDDWVYFQFNFSPYRNGTVNPQSVLSIWQQEFDWMDTHIDHGILTVLMHPKIIGRGSRMALFEQYIVYLKARNARFATMLDTANGLGG